MKAHIAFCDIACEKKRKKTNKNSNKKREIFEKKTNKNSNKKQKNFEKKTDKNSNKKLIKTDIACEKKMGAQNRRFFWLQITIKST